MCRTLLHGVLGLVQHALLARDGVCELLAIRFAGHSLIRAASKLCPFQVWLNTWYGTPLMHLTTLSIIAEFPNMMHVSGGWPGVAIIGLVMGAWRGTRV